MAILFWCDRICTCCSVTMPASNAMPISCGYVQNLRARACQTAVRHGSADKTMNSGSGIEGREAAVPGVRAQQRSQKDKPQQRAVMS